MRRAGRVRPGTAAENESCAPGPVPEAFLTGAAAPGSTGLSADLACGGPLTSARSWPPGQAPLIPARPGCLILNLPVVSARSLAGYPTGGLP